MMFALRQMMPLALMMTASPNDVADANCFRKHRIIARATSNIIFAKQMHHIAVGDASLYLASSPLLCYNTPKAVMLMKFKAKLNLKFYIVSILLLGFVALGWYGVYFLNANEILLEDNAPMDSQTKMLFTIAIGVAVLSWTFSFFTLIRQVLFGYAFVIDENGIHNTATAINVLAFIFVVPIRTIPFSAIERFSEDNGALTLEIDKAKIDVIPILRIFARKRYHLFSGFTVEKQDIIKVELEKYIK